MKARSRALVSAWAVLAMGAMVAAAPAHAALTVITSGGADYVGGTAKASYNSGSSFSNGGGGIFTFNRTGGTAPALLPDTDTIGKFVGICIEFSEAYTADGTYKLVGLEAAPVAGTVAGVMSGAGRYGTRADDLRRFLGRVYPVFGGSVLNTSIVGISAAQAALAVQIVVWEIANENYATAGSYSLTGPTGLFRVNSTAASSTARNQAIAWLTDFAANGSTWKPLNNLFAIVNDRRPGQDFVVQVVPIPAAAWLLGSGLLGLFAVARRKKTAS